MRGRWVGCTSPMTGCTASSTPSHRWTWIEVLGCCIYESDTRSGGWCACHRESRHILTLREHEQLENRIWDEPESQSVKTCHLPDAEPDEDWKSRLDSSRPGSQFFLVDWNQSKVRGHLCPWDVVDVRNPETVTLWTVSDAYHSSWEPPGSNPGPVPGITYVPESWREAEWAPPHTGDGLQDAGPDASAGWWQGRGTLWHHVPREVCVLKALLDKKKTFQMNVIAWVFLSLDVFPPAFE